MQGRAQTLEVLLPARQRHRPQHRQGPYTNRVGVGVGVGGGSVGGVGAEALGRLLRLQSSEQ
jgi:hypothetical protein